MNVTRKIKLRGHGRVPADDRWHMVECDIHLDSLLANLGEKALRNKSRKSRAMHGQIIVTVRECQNQE